MEIVAHRSQAAAHLENSLEAIAATLAAGISLIEVDVRFSRDGTPYLLHDPKLDRTAHLPWRLTSLNDAVVAQIRLTNGGQLPRLEEVLDAVGTRATVCLDLKEPAGVGALLRALDGRHANYRVWASDFEAVAAAARAGYATALISQGRHHQGLGAFLWRARSAGATAVSLYPADVEPYVAQSCANAGIALQSGTPNDGATWEQLARLGARTVITDRPLECATFLRARGFAIDGVRERVAQESHGRRE